MKIILSCCALALSAASLVFAPRDAAACSRCDPDAPRCQTANYSRCSTYAYSKAITVCEEWYAECAWVYAPDEVSADGSLALAAAQEPATLAVTEQVRGCHGLIVKRDYTAARMEQARAATRRILL